MKLISEEKIKQFAISESDKYVATDEYTNGLMVGIDVGVGLGVSFAETELKNLAIEFKQYCDKYNDEVKNSKLSMVLYSDHHLFEKFIEQRNK